MSKEAKVIVLYLGLLAVAFGASVAIAEYVYGDWTCAISECRRVVEVE